MEIPRRVLTGEDIYHFVKVLQIPNFRGVFCADEIPHHSGLKWPFCGHFEAHVFHSSKQHPETTQYSPHWGELGVFPDFSECYRKVPR